MFALKLYLERVLIIYFFFFQIMGVARKRDVGGYSKLMDKAAKCLHRLFELAPTKKRNYILDQVKLCACLYTVESCFESQLTELFLSF